MHTNRSIRKGAGIAAGRQRVCVGGDRILQEQSTSQEEFQKKHGSEFILLQSEWLGLNWTGPHPAKKEQMQGVTRYQLMS